MEHRNYTTVEEMGDQVNELYRLIAKAKALANELRIENYKNASAIYHKREEAVNEVRPLSMEERFSEARKYETLFEDIQSKLSDLEQQIVINY